MQPEAEADREVDMRAYLAGRRAVLVDLDGCFLAGDRLAPGALALTAVASDRLAVVSNNSTDDPAPMAAALARLGAPVPAQRVFLAGAAAVERLAAARPGAGTLVLAMEPIRGLAAARGLRLTDTDPEIVLVCRDLEFAYPRFERAVRALHGGAGLWVANPDLTHPDADGAPVPETGAFLAMLTACVTPRRTTVVGKPEPALFEAALAACGAAPADAVMIGDNPATDGAGAGALGIPFLQIGRLPGARAADLRGLLELPA